MRAPNSATYKLVPGTEPNVSVETVYGVDHAPDLAFCVRANHSEFAAPVHRSLSWLHCEKARQELKHHIE